MSDTYDLLLKGGTVIDARARTETVADVAITGAVISRIGADIPPSAARQVVDVTGLAVAPGLVDIHTHVYAGTGQRGAYSGDNSVYPDGHSFRSGVTTMVDAGGAGWRTFDDFKDRVIDRSRTRVLSLLNIIGRGMGGGPIEQDVDDIDPVATAAKAAQHPDVIVGVKTAHFRGPGWEAVDGAVAAGTEAQLPVMVDFGHFREERPFEELVTRRLRPDDMYTHMYLDAVPMLDERGILRPYLFEARERGVKFDVGHGAGSFWWKQAIPAIDQGWIPDSISTDLHTANMNGGMKDILNVMSKFLNQGLPLATVVGMATWSPAQQIRRTDLGLLQEGSVADIAVLAVETGEFGFLDVANFVVPGTRRLVCELTVKDGQVEWDLNGRAGEEWPPSEGRSPA